MAPLDLDPGRVTIFKNEKEGNEKRPDYRGELKTPAGQRLQVSLWISEAKSGLKYFSGRVEEPQAAQASITEDPLASDTTAANTPADGDDLPF